MYELRLRDTYLNEEKAKALLNDIKNNPGCCDAVWINNLYGYPKLQTIKNAIEKMKVIKNLFEEKGFPVSLQISNTIGHGNNYIKLYDYSGLVFEGSRTEGFTDYKGNVAEACFCPYNIFFLDYVYESTKLYAELKPECVWIDDDMRMYNHLPASYGCFCDSCIDRFNKKHGTRYTRSELVHEMDYGDINVRKAYIEQCRNALATLTSVIADALLEVSPDSKLAYQSARFNHYLGTDFDCVFDVMHKKTGKPVYYRPGG
ncbi:MAG: hypothetical protein IJZ20_05015, partial [Clostridia bacterium]|nr:hypothetical protein [Clostridia bacterium]